MNGYFVNAELKRSSVIFLGLFALFLVLMVFFLQLHHERLKADYIDTMGAIAYRIETRDSELAREIIPLITRTASAGDIQKGRSLLSQYGLTGDLEETLFPYLNKVIWKNYSSLTGVFLLMVVVFLILNYFQYAYFYERIRRITVGARKLIEGDYDIAIHEDREGDLAKLANAFNSMGNVIRNNLSELNKEKQFLVDLMSDISHQLKTPLSSLIVYNDIMLNKDLAPEQREAFLQKKHDQLERMKWLIYSILKLAKLDAKSIEFRKEEQSLNETIQNAIEALESKATLGGVKIVFTETEEVSFLHDREWLEEALINIIKNGIEHTAGGGLIAIGVMENPLYRRITIQDTGEGIREEDLPNIFKRFYKSPLSPKSESLGIGLALAKSIVESHEGIIEAQSQVGVGTMFVITFIK